MNQPPDPAAAGDVFVLPLGESFLVYAPLHHFSAVVDRQAAQQLSGWLLASVPPEAGAVSDIARALCRRAEAPPAPRQGPFAPAFLGLIPTRACNLACRYCGFLAPGASDREMDLGLARDAIDWYVGLVAASDRRVAEIHFFGGEPFCGEAVIDLAVHHARLRAARAGCEVRFEVATNGTFSPERCQWAADSLDSVVLSVDGPADIQDRQRPRRDGRGSFELVARSARILSEGTAELSFRVCVTADTVARMAEIAGRLCREFRPVSVCFEPVQPSAPSETAGLLPPDPWAFAAHYVRAAEIGEACGCDVVYAAADIRARRAGFCPVGQDVAIVSPDGSVAACYLLPEEWQARGLDLTLGAMDHGAPCLDARRVAAARALNVWNKPACKRCFVKWHCAGGCHVNHVLPATATGDYDRLCLQTRLIAVRNILRAMGRADLVGPLFEDRAVLENLAWQPSDVIADAGPDA